MANKITNIFNSRNAYKDNPALIYKKSLEKSKAKSGTEKWKIFKMAQDNQLLLKRLLEVQTCYDHKKYSDDYKKSLYYKKNICEFPSIPPNEQNQKGLNAYNTQGGFYSNANKTKESIKAELAASKTQTEFGYKPLGLKSTQDEKPKVTEGQILLFHLMTFFQDLFYCKFKFYLEDKKFVMAIQPKDKPESIYYIIIKGVSEISKLKDIYKNYEEIIDDLDHSIHNDLVFIKNPNLKISYLSIKFENNEDSSIPIKNIIDLFEQGEINGIKVEVEEKKLSPKKDVEEENKKKEFENEINSEDKEELLLNNLVSDDELKEEEVS